MYRYISILGILKELNNNTNTSDTLRIENGNFLKVDPKMLTDDISMANTESVDNVAERQKLQIEEQLCAVFEEAKSKLDNIDTRAMNEKKQVIIQLAKDLEGKVPTDTISIGIVNQLRGRVSERFVHLCLDNKYKQKYRAENAKKRKSKEQEKGNEENLAALLLLNHETKRRVIVIDSEGRSEVEDVDKSTKQHASDNVLEDARTTIAKARSLQIAAKQEEEINNQPKDLTKRNHQANQNIELHRDEIKYPNQINQQDQEWSETKLLELKDGTVIPLKITVNSAKREIISVEVDFEYIKEKKRESRERYQQYQH
jgi:hypothetical protein